MILYLQLALEFFKTGLFAIGGGLATLPFLREIAVNYNWYSLSELSNMIAIGNATPGPIGINMATYAGYSTGGILGGILATFFIVLPSYVIILIISKVLEKFRESIYVEGAFSGLRPAVVAMITVALIQLAQESFLIPNAESILKSISIKHIILFAIMLLVTKIRKKNSTLIYIIAGAIIGIIFKM